MNITGFAKKHGGLKLNIFRRDAPWMGALFMDTKEEREYIEKQHPDRVWSLIVEGPEYWLVRGDVDSISKLGNIVVKKDSDHKKILIK